MNTVLLIEDDPNYTEIIKRMLEGKYELSTASNVAIGLDRIQKSEPDAILLDLGLPDSRYDQTLAVVKAAKKRAAIIIVSGYDEPNFREKSIKGNASGFIGKTETLDQNHLVQEIEKAIVTNNRCGTMDSVTKNLKNA